MKKRGIFVKVFLYTTLLLALVISVTAALFAQQIVAFYNRTQVQLLSRNFARLTEQLEDVESGDYFRIAEEFFDNNQSLHFELQDPNGYTVFSSVRISHEEGVTRYQNIMMTVGAGYTLSASADTLDGDEYGQLLSRILVGVAVLLSLGMLSSFLFAKQMTDPIRRLVRDAETMSALMPVAPPDKRNDEIGELARMVHAMYGKLKDTIADLEEEKEAQRYFFAAASHELKTPIAATTALLQGMLDNIGEYKDHPKYLWECIKMMKEQNKIISEILEIVKLTDGRIRPDLQALSLLDAVAAALAASQALIKAGELSVVAQIPEGQRIMADGGMLHRALLNVLANAAQNTRKQGVIRIWSETNGDLVRLCVLNEGARIEEAMLPKLFDPFYRTDEARGAKSGRSGLGLTIVAKTLESMNLAFALENAPDGVLFWVDVRAM